MMRFLYLHPIRILRPLISQLRRRAEAKDRWGERAGFLYDLEHRLKSRSARKEIFDSHYRHTLEGLETVVGDAGTIVDYGCGPGFLTVEIARRYPEKKIIGAEVRSRSLTLNARLFPHIEWSTVHNIDPEPPAVYVLDGVVNYMRADELAEIVERAKAVVCYYAYGSIPSQPLGAPFDLRDPGSFELIFQSDVHAVAIIRGA